MSEHHVLPKLAVLLLLLAVAGAGVAAWYLLGRSAPWQEVVTCSQIQSSTRLKGLTSIEQLRKHAWVGQQEVRIRARMKDDKNPEYLSPQIWKNRNHRDHPFYCSQANVVTKHRNGSYFFHLAGEFVDKKSLTTLIAAPQDGQAIRFYPESQDDTRMQLTSYMMLSEDPEQYLVMVRCSLPPSWGMADPHEDAVPVHAVIFIHDDSAALPKTQITQIWEDTSQILEINLNNSEVVKIEKCNVHTNSENNFK